MDDPVDHLRERIGNESGSGTRKKEFRGNSTELRGSKGHATTRKHYEKKSTEGDLKNDGVVMLRQTREGRLVALGQDALDAVLASVALVMTLAERERSNEVPKKGGDNAQRIKSLESSAAAFADVARDVGVQLHVPLTIMSTGERLVAACHLINSRFDMNGADGPGCSQMKGFSPL